MICSQEKWDLIMSGSFGLMFLFFLRIRQNISGFVKLQVALTFPHFLKKIGDHNFIENNIPSPWSSCIVFVVPEKSYIQCFQNKAELSPHLANWYLFYKGQLEIYSRLIFGIYHNSL